MTTPSKVVFVDTELEKAFNSLSENDPIKKALVRAIQNIREDFQAGEYIKFICKKHDGGIIALDSQITNDFNENDILELELSNEPLKVICC